ncbi:MAG TPA: hypothetical protein VFU55_03390 [Terracidiphilus sp.]|nr:hypothetical protein [Terracidiphilus sp.]
MRKHVAGICGLVIAVGDALWMVLSKTTTPARSMTQLDLALGAVMLGMVAAIRGSLFWMLLSAAGLIEVIRVMF